MYPVDTGRRHTRINITPTSRDLNKCVTIGNLYMARFNCETANSSGGTFVVQFEDILARHQSLNYRNNRRRYCREIIKQMSHYGVKPTQQGIFDELDMPDATGVMYQSEWEQVTNVVWHHLLPFRDYMEQEWKEWPAAYPEKSHGVRSLIDMRGRPNGIKGYRGIPVYLMLSRVMLDMVSQRNCFINGEDCERYKDLYNLLCNVLRMPPPLQMTAPLLYRRTEGGEELPISTSDKSHNYFLHDVIQAGVPYHALWSFVEKHTFDQSRPNPDYGGGPYWQSDVDAKIVNRPVIDDKEWKEFLEEHRANKDQYAQEREERDGMIGQREKEEIQIRKEMLQVEEQQEYAEQLLVEKTGISAQELAQAIFEVRRELE